MDVIRFHVRSFFQVTDIKVKGTRLSLSIDIHAPTLLIPQKSSSPNLLAVMLGDLSIENFFKEASSAAGNGGFAARNHIIDNLLIRLNSLQMSRKVLCGYVDGRQCDICDEFYV